MAYEQRSGDISIFAATEKTKETQPDWKGTMIVPEGAKAGDKLEVALWAKGGKGTMLAGSAKPAREFRSEAGGGGGSVDRQGPGPVAGGREDRFNDPFADEVPFLTSQSII